MARRDDVSSRIHKTDPDSLAVMDLIYRRVKELGGTDRICVTLTDDMSREEKLMALIEKYLKEGTTIAEAEMKAESTLTFLDSF